MRSPNHALYCQQNDPVANGSQIVSLVLYHVSEDNVKGASAEIQFLWTIKYEMYFQERWRHLDLAWLQCTEQQKKQRFCWS